MIEPAADDAEPRPRGLIVVLNRDLFFGVRIGNLLKSDGFEPKFVKSTTELVEVLSSEHVVPALVLIDLGADPDWELLNHSFSADRPPPPILAFGPHKDVDGLRAAKLAGVTRVVSNSEFHRNALELIRRYADSKH
jgi:hypothetical protein